MPEELRRLAMDANKLKANRSLITIALYLSTLLLLFMALVQIVPIIYHFIPPYVVTTAEVLADGDSGDNKIVVRYHIIRHRICIMDLDRFVRSTADGDVIWRNRVPGGAVPLGERDVINRIELPVDTAPGEYELQTTISNQCPEGLHTTSTPPVKFRITPKS